MVKDHSDSMRKPAAATWGILLISSNDYFINHTTDRIVHSTVFVIPVVEHWLEQEIA